MRSLPLGAILGAGLLGACGGNPQPGANQAEDEPDGALIVTLDSNPEALRKGSTVFRLSRPAYVAVFDIQSADVRPVHPDRSDAEQRRFDTGLNRVPGWRVAFSRTCSAPAAPSSVHRLIVASERPLGLAALDSLVFKAFGHAPLTAVSPFDLMDRVVQTLAEAAPAASDSSRADPSSAADLAWDYAAFWSAANCDSPLDDWEVRKAIREAARDGSRSGGAGRPEGRIRPSVVSAKEHRKD